MVLNFFCLTSESTVFKQEARLSTYWGDLCQCRQLLNNSGIAMKVESHPAQAPHVLWGSVSSFKPKTGWRHQLPQQGKAWSIATRWGAVPGAECALSQTTARPDFCWRTQLQFVLVPVCDQRRVSNYASITEWESLGSPLSPSRVTFLSLECKLHENRDLVMFTALSALLRRMIFKIFDTC